MPPLTPPLADAVQAAAGVSAQASKLQRRSGGPCSRAAGLRGQLLRQWQACEILYSGAWARLLVRVCGLLRKVALQHKSLSPKQPPSSHIQAAACIRSNMPQRFYCPCLYYSPPQPVWETEALELTSVSFCRPPSPPCPPPHLPQCSPTASSGIRRPIA